MRPPGSRRICPSVACIPQGPLASHVHEGRSVHRPRHPERTALYRLFERHFDDYVRAHEERFEPRDGPLRGVVQESVEAFLGCGRFLGGLARIRCPRCRGEHPPRSSPAERNPPGRVPHRWRTRRA
ncbi:MAG: hypothetical protein ACT4PV_09380 [Planctomycetaceae bacterium]